MPKISVLTPSYNQCEFIEQNILSVLDQDYPSFEHIVVDGGSTDGTVEILKRYPHLIWVSEKDGGQADALNKGFRLATGDIIGWLNSDDYYERRIFRDVAGVLKDGDSVQWAIGRVTKVSSSGEKRVVDQRVINLESLLWDPDIVTQQPAFYRRALIASAGGWDPSLYMVMDYDLWLRLARNSAPALIDSNWAYFREHPGQKTSFPNTRRQIREILAVHKRQGLPLRARLAIRRRKLYYLGKAYLKHWLVHSGLYGLVE